MLFHHNLVLVVNRFLLKTHTPYNIIVDILVIGNHDNCLCNIHAASAVAHFSNMDEH